MKEKVKSNLERSVSTQAQLRRKIRKELKLKALSEPRKAASPIYRGHANGMRTITPLASGLPYNNYYGVNN